MSFRFTFAWDEEDGTISYEQLMDQLMALGAYDIVDEEIPDEVPSEPTKPKKMKPRKSHE